MPATPRTTRPGTQPHSGASAEADGEAGGTPPRTSLTSSPPSAGSPSRAAAWLLSAGSPAAAATRGPSWLTVPGEHTPSQASWTEWEVLPHKVTDPHTQAGPRQTWGRDPSRGHPVCRLRPGKGTRPRGLPGSPPSERGRGWEEASASLSERLQGPRLGLRWELSLRPQASLTVTAMGEGPPPKYITHRRQRCEVTLLPGALPSAPHPPSADAHHLAAK